jgi:hypothetical protein
VVDQCAALLRELQRIGLHSVQVRSGFAGLLLLPRQMLT